MLRITHILRMREYLTAGVVVMSAAAIYALLVQPSLRLFAEMDQAVAARNQALQQQERLAQQYETLQRQIAQAQSELEHAGGKPPSVGDRDLQVAKVTLLAGKCGVRVDEYVPIGSVAEGNAQASFVQFTATATFPDCRRFLQRLESELDYIDVTNLSIQRPSNERDGQCTVSWSCQINGLVPIAVPCSESAVSSQALQIFDDHTTVEVALHGS